MMRAFGLTALLACALLVPGAARADVKAGVDAWTQGDYDRAVTEWRPLAIAGDADAQFNLGQAYKLGRGVPADIPTALDWFKRAADTGHARASDNYALLLFQQGKRQEAMPLIRASAERGEPRAQYIYATALFNGDLVTQDWPHAYALMTRAAQSDVTQASQSLAQMDQYIPIEQRQRGLALAADLAAGKPVTATAKARPTQPPLPPKPTVLAEAGAPKPAPVRAKPPVAAAAPATPGKAATGRWRIQLGAFSDAARARALWQSTAGRLKGLQPYFVEGGGVTRLQAGPLASEADAASLCARVKESGVACLVKAI